MFAKDKISQSMIDAVNSVLSEDKKRLINDAEMDETGFHKAAHAAKKAGQSHFEFQGKKYPAAAKSHKEAIEVDEAAVIVPTPTGKKVYGSSYGNSAAAVKAQTKHSVDDVKEPTKKDIEKDSKNYQKTYHGTSKHYLRKDTQNYMSKVGEEVELDEDGNCVTPDQAKKIADKEVGKHEKGMHKGKKGTVKEGTFAAKLLAIYEAKSSGTEEMFTDNNMGEEMTDKQKAKREKIVMSMKKGEAGMKQRYGKNWKNVMYATATKQAMKEDSSDEWEGEFERIDELSKGTMLSYRVKSIGRSGDFEKKGYEAGKKGGGAGSDKADKLFNKADSVAATRKRAQEKMRKEDVELDEATPAKNTDIADKAYLKHKPGTVKGTMTQLGRFLRVKPEIKEEVEQIEEANITHAAHFDDPKTGKWASMALLTAKNDQEAMEQAKDLLRTHAYRNYKLSAVEKHEPIKMKMKMREAVEVETERSNERHKITTDMLSGRQPGGKLNSFKNFKVDLVTSGEETIATELDKGEDTKEKQKITTNPGPVDIKFDDKLGHPTVQSHFSSEHQITHEEVQITEKTIAGTSGWKKMTKDVKDKSGAIHTPMSRAKDLARKAFKKIKSETMMGKISN